MDVTEVLADLSSIHYWINVVLVSLIVTVFGNLLTRRFDSSWGRFSSWRDKRAKEKDENYQTDLQNLFRSPALVKKLRDKEARDRLKGIVSLILAVGLLLLGFNSAYLLLAEGSGSVRLSELKWFSLIFFILSNVMVTFHFLHSHLASRAERLLEDYYSLLAQEEKKDMLPKGK